MIAAITRSRALGCKGRLLYHIAEDHRRFKGLTMGNVVIMGRKTWESLPKRPLPSRRNIVVTRNPDYAAEGAEVVTSVEQALRICGPLAHAFIIGGGEIYAAAIPFAGRLELTVIDEEGTPREADTFFPPIDPAKWEQINRTPPMKDPHTGTRYAFVTYARRPRPA